MYRIILAILFLCSEAQAQVGSTADSLGGAGIASVQAVESGYLNPASLSQLKAYYVGGQYFRKNQAGNDNLDQFTLTVTDGGADSLFPGALIIRQRNFNVAGQTVKEQVYHIGVAVPLSKTFALGFSGYLQRTNLPIGSDYNQTNMDASAYWKMSDQLSFGFIAKGLFGSKQVAFAQSQVLPSSGLGVQYTVIDILRLRADATYQYEQNSTDHFTQSVGAEFLLREDFILRAGYKADDIKGEGYYTAGLGWNGPRLKAGYAYQNETRNHIGSTHTIDIWLDL
jgi:hypothetical protein